jgi:hypothetical protein
MGTTKDSNEALACFAHGLAHLIAVYGYRRGAAIAGMIALDFLESPPEEGLEWEVGSGSPRPDRTVRA